ncbi:hypothetical protein GLI01_07150 [Gluconacetobacter liquefaciens]|uniref:Uncharacterized protein n=2 Tax=Gluconacetobacter liquefaciens TaxID=89584 RepID=A0A370G3F4_GLULI|nr:hypothetical protein [Gluconacetobacter liquefaciens]RDI38262.1 hypothetical protein C7453_104206 [Gluconacetobacter liquefaciens]GBQ96398.1 hypothetical protein AA0522_0774 [Gluconacetobacter liquefaciens NRIC 0522]GEB36680.1 hypothetical protein GLI01_07150 [Gluconacetobacter liquefaciens]
MVDAGMTRSEERFIRWVFGTYSGSNPSLSAGIVLPTWKSGPLAGQPRIPASIRDLVARGLLRVAADEGPPRAYFTSTGLGAVRRMFIRPRFDTQLYVHLWREVEHRGEYE